MAAILQSVIVTVFTKESATQHIEMCFFFPRVAMREIGSAEGVFFTLPVKPFNACYLRDAPTV